MKEIRNAQRFRAFNKKSPTFFSSCIELITSIILLVALVSYCIFQNNRTASPLGASAQAKQFSEARAFRVIERLANDFPHRQVGGKHYSDAAAFLLEQARILQQHSASTTQDLSVQVTSEISTGAADISFLHVDFTNAYSNLSNIVLKIVPADAAAEKAVLVNAHFDSTLGSPGASDCASCVGVALELARLLISDESRKLQAPVTFLLNGGEEAFFLGAHAFREQSRFRNGLGAIINLESTGPGGPDIVFQHSGAWTMKSYARAAKHPRGTVIAQDFFEAGILPADTDFRMMSSKYLGELPGLDIAFLLDSGAYHMLADVPERIRPGTVQAMGENVAALVVDIGRSLRQGEDNMEEDEKLIFFDVLGLFMVTYPMRLARLLHRTPLLLALALPLFSFAVGAKQQRTMYQRYLEQTKMAAVALLSAACAVIAPVLFGCAFVSHTGRPLAWVGHSVAAYALYMPVALAGALWPYALVPRAQPRWVLLGYALQMGAVAELLTAAGLGAGYALAAWALAAVLASLLVSEEDDGRVWLPWLVLTAAPAVLVAAPPALMLSLHIVQKAATSGAPFLQYGTDISVAVVLGLALVGCLGFLGGLFALQFRRKLWVPVLLLCIFSVFFGVVWTQTMQPYTIRAPKKVYMYHMHHVDQSGKVARSTCDLAAIDSAPVSWALPDSLASLPREPWHPASQIVLFPVNNFMQGISLSAPAPLPGTQLPHLEMVDKTCAATDESGSCVTERLQISLSFSKFGFYGAMNFTGDMLAWSFTNKTWPAKGSPKAERIVRFTGGEGSETWRFWVDIMAGGNLDIDLVAASIATAGEESYAAMLLASFPAWTSVAAAEAFHMHWAFDASGQ